MRYLLSILFIALHLVAYTQQDTIHVYFDAKSAELNSAALQTIDSNIYYEILIKGTKAGIIGYGDNTTNKKKNAELAQLRALTVARYLVSMGLTENDIQLAEQQGEIIRDKKDKEKHPEDMRVDIIVGGLPDASIVPMPAAEPKTNNTNTLADLGSMNTNDIVRLDHIEFEAGSDKLLQSSYPTLQQLLKVLNDNPGLSIRIEGHVCCVDAYKLPKFPTPHEQTMAQMVKDEAQDLSLRRAMRVQEYLTDNHISKNRLSTKGYGNTVPVYEADGKTINKQKNRRVEIRITSGR